MILTGEKRRRVVPAPALGDPKSPRAESVVLPIFAPFDPARVTKLLREGAAQHGDASDNHPNVAVLQRLDAVLTDPNAVDAAQQCQELVHELFKPLMSQDGRLHRRLSHLIALRSVLLRLNPLIAVFKFDDALKECVAHSLIDAAACDFLTGGVCFDILNALYFALDFTNVCAPQTQRRAFRVAAETFFQAADAIEMMSSVLPSLAPHAMSTAQTRAARAGLVPARDAVKEALVFIMSSRESVLLSHLDLVARVGRRLMEQSSLGFAVADDVFDTLEDPDAINESYIFSAMLEHEHLPVFFRDLVRTISRQGQFCAERFTMQRLMFHGYRRIKQLGCLDFAVALAVRELAQCKSPNLAFVLCSCSSLKSDMDAVAAGDVALAIYAPLVRAAIVPVLSRTDKAAEMLSALVIMARLAPGTLVDACRRDAGLEALVDDLIELAASPARPDLVAGGGQIVFVLSYSSPKWICEGPAARRERACVLAQKMLALDVVSASAVAQWMRSHLAANETARYDACFATVLDELAAATHAALVRLAALLKASGACVDPSRFATNDWSAALPPLSEQTSAGIADAWELLSHAVDKAALSVAHADAGLVSVLTLYAGTLQCKVRSAGILAMRAVLVGHASGTAKGVRALTAASPSFQRALAAWEQAR